MKTERNEFQQLVDHQMMNMEWNAAKSRAVFHKLRQDKPAPRRSVLRYAVTFALAVAVLAVAITILRPEAKPDMVVAAQPTETVFIPIETPDTRAEAVRLAREAVMEKYGLTLQTLGVFRDDCSLTDTGWVVRFYTNNQISSRLAGEYTVEKANGAITASWTHDDVDPAVWADGELNRTAWGHPQLLHAITDQAREAMAITQEINAEDYVTIDYSYIEGTELWGEPLLEIEPSADDMTVEAAAELAISAFEHQMGVSVDEVTTATGEPFLLAENGSLRATENGTRVWVFTPSYIWEDESYGVTIFINAQTGELERLEYTTLGNG